MLFNTKVMEKMNSEEIMNSIKWNYRQNLITIFSPYFKDLSAPTDEEIEVYNMIYCSDLTKEWLINEVGNYVFEVYKFPC